MRKPAILIASLAAVALTGLAGVTVAKTLQMHALTVQLPDGGTARVLYSGDRPPLVSVTPFGLTALSADADDPFAALDRVAAQLDRQATAMLDRPMGGRSWAEASSPAPGAARSYSFASTLSGKGVCGQSVEIIARGDGKPPITRTRRWGDCAASPPQPGTIAHGAI